MTFDDHRPQRRWREAESSLLWAVVGVALLGVMGLCLATLDRDVAVPPAALASCVAVAGVGLAIAARRDFYEFCGRAGVLAFAGAVACALVATSIAGAGSGWLLGAILLGSSSLAWGVLFWREGHADDPLPNLVRDQVERGDVVEIDGVQFALLQSDVEVQAGEELMLQLLVQNGLDSERRFEVRLQPRPDIGRAGHLVVDKELQVDLAAGAAAALWLPIAVQPRARGAYSVRVVPCVSGSGGTRVRRWRAKRYRRPATGLERLAGAFFGIFLSGGGLQVEFRVRRTKGASEIESPLSPGRVEMIYLPAPGLVRGMALHL
jgi:hypothetical protein